MLCDNCIHGKCVDKGEYTRDLSARFDKISPALYACELREDDISEHIRFTCEDYDNGLAD